MDRPEYNTDGGAAAAAKSLQSCPTLCDPHGLQPTGSSVHVILQARILERTAISWRGGGVLRVCKQNICS